MMGNALVTLRTPAKRVIYKSVRIIVPTMEHVIWNCTDASVTTVIKVRLMS